VNATGISRTHSDCRFRITTQSLVFAFSFQVIEHLRHISPRSKTSVACAMEVDMLHGWMDLSLEP
jgi:hypothetical protein